MKDLFQGMSWFIVGIHLWMSADELCDWWTSKHWWSVGGRGCLAWIWALFPSAQNQSINWKVKQAHKLPGGLYNQNAWCIYLYCHDWSKQQSRLTVGYTFSSLPSEVSEIYYLKNVICRFCLSLKFLSGLKGHVIRHNQKTLLVASGRSLRPLWCGVDIHAGSNSWVLNMLNVSLVIFCFLLSWKVMLQWNKL